MSKGNKESQLERFAGSYDITLYTDNTLKCDLHSEFYTLPMDPCLEKRCVIYYAQ
jgi:hypothetical protein